MSDLTEFQQRAVAMAALKMLSHKHFSICTLRDIAKTLGREQYLAGKDYEALACLHCIDYADMGETLFEQTQRAALKILGIDFDEFMAATRPKKPMVEEVDPEPERRGVLYRLFNVG